MIQNDIFLRKYMMYARTFNPVLSKEAEVKLHEYWAKITDSPRILTLLDTIAKSIARLELTNTVTDAHVNQVIDYFNDVLPHYQHVEDIPDTLEDIATNECLLMPNKDKSRMLLEGFNKLRQDDKK